MPQEDRRIIFDNEEVYKALYALNFQKQIKQLPAGNITNVTEQPSGMLTIQIQNPLDNKGTSTHDITSDYLAAALMLFCRGSGIPLPRGAKKSVLIADGQVTLRVQK